MPPATSPWTFLVPALGAFLGVVLAQWWTGRREDRNWQRQREMYAQQREDQRERDRESWAREDRHRFVELKREKYVTFLTAMQGILDAFIVINEQINCGPVPMDTENTYKARVFELLSDAEDKGRSLFQAFDSVDLVAPNSVLVVVKEYRDVFIDQFKTLARLTPVKDIRDLDLPDRIRAAMRADLTGEGDKP